MAVDGERRVPHVLAVNGSDSGAGAGVQADMKTCGALGVYCSSVITALTAQNTAGVQGVHPVPEELAAQQLRSVLWDMAADVKINVDIIQGRALGPRNALVRGGDLAGSSDATDIFFDGENYA